MVGGRPPVPYKVDVHPQEPPLAWSSGLAPAASDANAHTRQEEGDGPWERHAAPSHPHSRGEPNGHHEPRPRVKWTLQSSHRSL